MLIISEDPVCVTGKILVRCPVYILVDQTVQKRGLAVVKPETEAMYGIF